MDKETTLSIPTFYSGRSIFITGASGYLGKALIEKLLRSCPDTREIFLLMRPKTNMCIEERLQQILANSLFDRLRNERPHCFKKLIPLKGDIKIEGLGLSSVDRNTLIERVSIIFHVAANVRFDNTLKKAIFINLRATRDICVLSKSLKNLMVLVYVSSTYSQVDKFVVDEIVYPMEIDWRKTIQIAETMDDYVLEVFKSKYLGAMPNTYTFTKKLAEQVITDYSESLPCVICRPSIISPAINEPAKGWLENFNGPVRLMVGCGKGIVRVFYNNPFASDNYIPIDTVVKAMIVATWKRGVMNKNNDMENIHPLVYNCSTDHNTNLSRLTMLQMSKRILLSEIPFENIIWTPETVMIQNHFFYRILVLLLHVIPAIFIDGLLRIVGKSSRLLKQYRKIFTVNNHVAHFLFND
ncbi:Fatty acyl-CoA reductase 1 [Camponotus floridanus]|uniref:Fatty acyl-CoA reductase n=2 Tax=Camponotus floridanus TaxID=104421 RepID=E1ZWH5_CAMFO|nr:Fatty acyl-CoA reductase 1 [Camponotus floridanus]